jgi:hypothetical protein
MAIDSDPDSAERPPIDAPAEAAMQRTRPPITIRPPERDGDRDALIAALAAAVVAIARQRAAHSADSSHDAAQQRPGTVKTA